MQSHRSSTPAAVLGSRAMARRQRIVTTPHVPSPVAVPGDSAVGAEDAPTAAELVADVMALIDASLVQAERDCDVIRYIAVGAA